MAISTGISGRGLAIRISDMAPSPTYVEIANVRSIEISGRDAEQVDFTHLQSTSGYREFRNGFKDPGYINFTYHYNPSDASHRLVLELFQSGENFDFIIDYSNSGIDIFELGYGYIRNPADVDINMESAVSGAASIRMVGSLSLNQVVPENIIVDGITYLLLHSENGEYLKSSTGNPLYGRSD